MSYHYHLTPKFKFGTVDGGIETIVVPTENLPKLDSPVIHNSSPIKGSAK